MSAFSDLNLKGALPELARQWIFKLIPGAWLMGPLELAGQLLNKALGREKDPPILGFLVDPEAQSIGEANAVFFNLYAALYRANRGRDPQRLGLNLGSLGGSGGTQVQGSGAVGYVLEKGVSPTTDKLISFNKALRHEYRARGVDGVRSFLRAFDNVNTLLLLRVRYEKLVRPQLIGTVQAMLDSAEEAWQIDQAVQGLSKPAAPKQASTGATVGAGIGAGGASAAFVPAGPGQLGFALPQGAAGAETDGRPALLLLAIVGAVVLLLAALILR